MLELDIRGQIEGDLLGSSRNFLPASHPDDVRRLHAVIFFEDGASPDTCGQLVLGDADAPSLQVGGAVDALVRADVNGSVAECAGREDRNADIGIVSPRGLDGKAAQGKLADIEICIAEGTEENLFGFQSQIDRIDAIDGDCAVQERAGAIIVTDGY